MENIETIESPRPNLIVRAYHFGREIVGAKQPILLAISGASGWFGRRVAVIYLTETVANYVGEQASLEASRWPIVGWSETSSRFVGYYLIAPAAVPEVMNYIEYSSGIIIFLVTLVALNLFAYVISCSLRRAFI